MRRVLPNLLTCFAVVTTAFACADDSSVDGAGSGGASAAGITGASGVTGGAAGMAGASGMGGTAGGTAGAGGMAGAAGTAAGAGGMGAGFVPGSPTWSAIWNEIIVGTGCNGGALCHGGTVGMLQMVDKAEAYAALRMPAMGMNLTLMPPHCADSGLMRIVPGNPDMSLLVRKVEMMMPGCGTVMPPNPPMLTAAQQMQIRMWVANGAMDN